MQTLKQYSHLAFQFICKHAESGLLAICAGHKMSLQLDKLIHMSDNCIHFDSIMLFSAGLALIGYLIYILIKYTQH